MKLGRWSAVLLLVGLAVLPYVRSPGLPFISDDYLLVEDARRWGPPSGWPSLWNDILYRSRATEFVAAHAVTSLFGERPEPLQWLCIALHGVNVLLLSWLGRWQFLGGYRVMGAAAGFFAVHEIHQEAVYWISSLPELLMMSSLLLTLHALLEGRTALAFGAFVLALLSKESGVAAVPIAGLALWLQGHPWRDILRRLAAFALLSVFYALEIFQAGSSHLHLTDGTFSLQAPFLQTLANSTGRLFWFWGLLAVVALAWTGWRAHSKRLAVAAGWILCGLLPYSFLTYMPRVPSRHTYLASAGVAIIAGLAWFELEQRWRPAALTFVAALVILHNCAYVWIVKHPQYAQRAIATETLVDAVRQHPGPVALTCFPYTREVAESTLRVRLPERAPAVQWRVGEPIQRPTDICIDDTGRLVAQR
jgi:hypothetical protein